MRESVLCNVSCRMVTQNFLTFAQRQQSQEKGGVAKPPLTHQQPFYE